MNTRIATAQELQEHGEYRIGEIADAAPDRARFLTGLNLRVARTDAQDMLRGDIAPLLAGGETTGAHLITGYLHRAVPLETLAGRVVPAIFGLRQLGEHDKADALERHWHDWIAGFNLIAAGCPQEMPSGATARRKLTVDLAGQLQQLLRDVVWTLDNLFADRMPSNA